MAKAQVYISHLGGGFRAEVEVNFDPARAELPREIEGHFYVMNDASADLIIHADRQPEINEPKMWFNGKKHGYRFWMKSKTSNQFTGESIG